MKELNNIWKHLQQELNAAEKQSLQDWKALSAANQRMYTDTEKIWEQSGKLDDIILQDPDSAWLDLDARLSARQSGPSRRMIRIIGIAASLLLMASVILWFYLGKQDPLYQSVSTLQERAEIDLADGSKVMLAENSSLRYFTRIEKDMVERRIFLQGLATFEVARDSLLPFVVQLSETGVEALGTKFLVDQSDTNRVSVENIEGLIRFFELANEDNSVTIEQGQIFSYDGTSFSNDTAEPEMPPQTIFVAPDKEKSYSVEQLIDILLERFDGKFNTGPYAELDMKDTIRINLDQSLPEIMKDLTTKARVQFKKTCPDCFELDVLKVD